MRQQLNKRVVKQLPPAAKSASTANPAAKADTTQSQAVEDSSNIKPSDITQADFDHMYQYGDMDQHQDLTDAQLQALGLKHGEYYRIINGKKYIYHVKADYQLLDENGKPSKYDFDYIPFHNADGTVSSAQDRIGAFPVLIDPNDPKFDFWFNAATTAGNAYDKIYYIPAGKGNTIYVTKRTQLSSIDARRGVVPDAAYTVSDAQWDTTPADPDHPYNANVPGTYHENVAITMPTGKTTTADATIVVVDLQGKTIYTHIGGADAPAAESSVTGAPAGSKSFTCTSQPSTDKAGDFTNAVNVTFPDGSTATANVNIHVLAPTGHDVTIKIGDPAPSAESIITNNTDLNSNLPGTTYTWKDGQTPDVSKPGVVNTVVTVHWPDGKTTDVPTKITVQDSETKTTESESFTRTITDNVPGQAPIITKQTITFTQTVTKNYEGKVINRTAWTAADGNSTWAEYTAKGAAGYTTDVEVVSAESVGPKYGQDEDVEINYDANRQSQVINYVDNSDKQTVVSHETKVGPVNSSTNFIAHAPHNWTIVPGQNIPNKINFGVNEAAPIVIYVEHATSDVSDSKDITRIVSYQDPLSGKKLTLTTQTTTLSRTGKKDVITGQIKWGGWSTSSLQAVTAPTLRGYHVLNPDAAAALAVNGSTASVIEAVFNYQADQFTQDINYVDVNTGSVIKHDSVIGQSNQKNVPYQGTVPDKWQLVEGQNIPTSFDFGVEQPSPVVIYIQHGVNDNKNADAHTATRRIYKIDPVTNTKTLIATQVASVHREVVTYLVTGAVIYQGQWTADHTGSDIWQEVNAPELPGYCIASSYSAPEVRIDGNTADAEVGFSYAAKWHMQKVNYVAKDTGSIVNSDYLQGQTGKVQAATAKTDVDAKTDQNKGANVAAQDNQAPKANDTQDTNDVKPSNITRAEFDQMYKNGLDQHQDLTDAQLQAWGLKRDQYYRVINGKKYVFRVKADYQLLDENEKPTKYHFDYVPFHNADGTVSEAQDRIGNFPSTLDLTDPDANFWLNVSTTAGNAYDFIYYIPAGKSNTIYVNKGTQINSIDPRKGVAPDSQYTVTDAQ